jgi:hypothetical protein
MPRSLSPQVSSVTEWAVPQADPALCRWYRAHRHFPLQVGRLGKDKMKPSAPLLLPGHREGPLPRRDGRGRAVQVLVALEIASLQVQQV